MRSIEDCVYDHHLTVGSPRMDGEASWLGARLRLASPPPRQRARGRLRRGALRQQKGGPAQRVEAFGAGPQRHITTRLAPKPLDTPDVRAIITFRFQSPQPAAGPRNG